MRSPATREYSLLCYRTNVRGSPDLDCASSQSIFALHALFIGRHEFGDSETVWRGSLSKRPSSRCNDARSVILRKGESAIMLRRTSGFAESWRLDICIVDNWCCHGVVMGRADWSGEPHRRSRPPLSGSTEVIVWEKGCCRLGVVWDLRPFGSGNEMAVVCVCEKKALIVVQWIRCVHRQSSMIAWPGVGSDR